MKARSKLTRDLSRRELHESVDLKSTPLYLSNSRVNEMQELVSDIRPEVSLNGCKTTHQANQLFALLLEDKYPLETIRCKNTPSSGEMMRTERVRAYLLTRRVKKGAESRRGVLDIRSNVKVELVESGSKRFDAER
jgi:hypothetical protein